jgi:hypothetical protein
MKRFKGTVKNNVVVLEEGVQLPEGAEVEVTLPSRRRKLEEAVEHLLSNLITHPVGMQEIIEEDKSERDKDDETERQPTQ